MTSEPDQDPGGSGHGDDKDVKGGGCGSVRPGVPVPKSVLVADMGNGALLVQSWPDGPGAYLCAEDAGALRRALEAAFGTDTHDESRSQS